MHTHVFGGLGQLLILLLYKLGQAIALERIQFCSKDDLRLTEVSLVDRTSDEHDQKQKWYEMD